MILHLDTSALFKLYGAESSRTDHEKHLLHFACFDRALNQAAEAIGLHVLAMEE